MTSRITQDEKSRIAMEFRRYWVYVYNDDVLSNDEIDTIAEFCHMWTQRELELKNGK